VEIANESPLRLIPDAHEETGIREFFRVAKVVPLDQDIVSVPPGTKVKDALEVMREYDYSQLPVMAGRVVVGVFTYRSLARGLASMRPQDDPLESAVEDLVEDLEFHRPRAEVEDILPALDRDGAVLIGEEENLIAVATNTDVIDFLWETTRPFILLQDIELAIRDLMSTSCQTVDELLSHIGSALPEKETKPLDELTLGELLIVLLHGPSYGSCFRSSFGPNRHLVEGQLAPVREIRNKVFHFRSDLTPEELDMLISVRLWLHRKTVLVKAAS
jgi:predicted transcriptional regulator